MHIYKSGSHQTENHPPRRPLKKRLFLTLIFLLVTGLTAGLYSRVSTLLTVKPVLGEQLFEMDYRCDYKLDGLLSKGVSDINGIIDYFSKTLLFGWPVENPVEAKAACTIFLANTRSGTPLVGRNFDYECIAPLIVHTAPKQGYRSVSTVSLDFIGIDEATLPSRSLEGRLATLLAPYVPMDGINEKGLFVGVLEIEKQPTAQNTGKLPITTTVAIRMLLDKATNTHEAVELLKQYDMHALLNSDYHFFIADATGNSVVVEYIDNRMMVVTDTVASNFALSRILEYPLDAEPGEQRYALAKARLAETRGQLSTSEAMQLLADTRHTEPNPTQWSIVYDLQLKTGLIAVDTDFNHLYAYALKKGGKP